MLKIEVLLQQVVSTFLQLGRDQQQSIIANLKNEEISTEQWQIVQVLEPLFARNNYLRWEVYLQIVDDSNNQADEFKFAQHVLSALEALNIISEDSTKP